MKLKKNIIKENKGFFIALAISVLMIACICLWGWFSMRDKSVEASADEYDPTQYQYANYANLYEDIYSGYAIRESVTPFEIVVSTVRPSLGWQSINIPLYGINTGNYITCSADFEQLGDNIPCFRVQYVEADGLAVGDPFITYYASNVGNMKLARVGEPPTATAKLCLMLYFNHGDGLSDTSTYYSVSYKNVMVARNTSPFIPNLEALARYEYEKGESTANSGFFKDSVLEVEPRFSDNTASLVSRIEPVTVYGGISLKSAYDYYVNNYDITTIKSYNVNVLFDKPVYSTDLRLILRGQDLGKSFYVRTDKGEDIEARFVYDSSIMAYGLELKINSLDFYAVGLYDYEVIGVNTLGNLVLQDNLSGYRVGYSQGYNDGVGVLDIETQKSYENGYNEGKQYGEKIGYDLGFAKGQTDDPYSLGDFFFSIVDAPLRVVREALNFEILGVNISSFVLFILTALIVIFVVKKIKGD